MFHTIRVDGVNEKIGVAGFHDFTPSGNQGYSLANSLRFS